MTFRGAGLGIRVGVPSEVVAVNTGTDFLSTVGTEAKSILGSHGVASRMKVIHRLAAGGEKHDADQVL